MMAEAVKGRASTGTAGWGEAGATSRKKKLSGVPWQRSRCVVQRRTAPSRHAVQAAAASTGPGCAGCSSVATNKRSAGTKRARSGVARVGGGCLEDGRGCSRAKALRKAKACGCDCGVQNDNDRTRSRTGDSQAPRKQPRARPYAESASAPPAVRVVRRPWPCLSRRMATTVPKQTTARVRAASWSRIAFGYAGWRALVGVARNTET